MTPLLTRIDQELSVCTDPLREAELLAERACYLARIGDFAEATSIVASLRRVYGDGRNARIAVWLMLAEGIILFFQSLDVRSRDRILRAYAICAVLPIVDLKLLTASWLAHLEFNRMDFRAMKNMIQICLTDGLQEASAWRVRIRIILADALMYARREVDARFWYEKARQDAIALGDDATLGALIYNRAALALGNLKIDSIESEIDPERARLLAKEVASASAYWKGAGQRALGQLLMWCEARILLVERRFSDAVLILKYLVKNDAPKTLQTGSQLLQIEYALALYECRMIQDAESVFSLIDVGSYSEMNIDDQIVFVSTYINVGECLGCHEIVKPFVPLVEPLRKSYTQMLRDLQLMLDELDLMKPSPDHQLS